MKTYPMSAADASWFHNDGPSNLAVVMGVTLTKEPLDFERVRQVYSERLVTFERFRQRVVETGFPLPTPHWQDMPNFDIDQHLHHIGLPAPHNQAALVALVNDIASAPLDHSIPLWQTWVVDDVEGGSALIMRCHHCIADGTAMMIVLQRLYDPAPGAPPLQAPRPRGKRLAQADKGLLAPAINAVAGAARGALALGAGAGMLMGELLRKDDPPSPLKGDFAPAKRVAWSEPFPVSDIKAIGLRHGAKVNDVLVAAMTGALRTYLKGRGVDVNNTTLRAMVPVDLRPPERMGQLGNEFGLVVLDLAVTKARADQRIALTKARMDALKRSPEPLATRALLDLMGRLPKVLEDFSNDLFGRKASLVMTNVTGPREELYLAGAPIERMLAWAPHPGKQLGMAVSIFSYKGMAGLTVIGDAHLVPDPETITAEFNREFRKMLKTITTADAATGQSAQRKSPAKKAAATKVPVKKAPAKTVAPKTKAAAKAAAKVAPAKRPRAAKPAAKAARK
ncbi:MAG: wax ester/triacylglycerol synthase family O-acyltransferase [Burkholderiaceae bacterium]|nr:wax ester/triacylglycerol synthase family O-acyltransferase [Burkholderiaceae bacterium]